MTALDVVWLVLLLATAYAVWGFALYVWAIVATAMAWPWERRKR